MIQSELLEGNCECGHNRKTHSKSRDCGQCGCPRFLTPQMRAVLASLRVPFAQTVADETAKATANMAKAVAKQRFMPVVHDADNPQLCVVCKHVILADTEEWPEPLCHEHFYEQCNLPPRAVLSFKDGHREMRNNVIFPAIYRDVEQDDNPDGDVSVKWFERTHEQREDGRLVMQFYREIESPVDALGRPKTPESAVTIQSILDELHAEQQKSRHRGLMYWAALAIGGIAGGLLWQILH